MDNEYTAKVTIYKPDHTIEERCMKFSPWELDNGEKLFPVWTPSLPELIQKHLWELRQSRQPK